MRMLRGIAAILILLATASCTRSLRVSRGAVDKLTRNGEHFVLVFGSMSIAGGKADRPVVRFLHPGSAGQPDTLLWSATITTGERFYAVLHAPDAAAYLDAVYVEAGSETAGFDRIIYRHMSRDQEPLALYVGEIQVRPAADRRAQGQKVVTEVRDDFQDAQRELRRFYPRFDGPVISTIGVRR